MIALVILGSFLLGCLVGDLLYRKGIGKAVLDSIMNFPFTSKIAVPAVPRSQCLQTGHVNALSQLLDGYMAFHCNDCGAEEAFPKWWDGTSQFANTLWALGQQRAAVIQEEQKREAVLQRAFHPAPPDPTEEARRDIEKWEKEHILPQLGDKA